MQAEPDQRRGRPRAFDREQAVLAAARLFWRRGYSGASTRALTEALGVSASSLYAAFGSKAGLFEEAVRTYAERYREIYWRAVLEASAAAVVERVLVDSVHEFTQPEPSHPGCLVSSAAMADSTDTLDTGSYIAELHASNEQTLVARLEQAARDGALADGADPPALAKLVQSVWHGLSAQSNLGATRGELLATARLAHALICRQLEPTPPARLGD